MSDSLDYQPADWSAENVAAFWDYQSRSTPSGGYFSEGNRDALVHLAQWRGLLPARVVDYGCGRGPLFEPLLDCGCEVGGLEFSSDSAMVANAQFSQEKRFLGVRTQPAAQGETWESGHFDLCYCCEVIEHLTDEVLAPTFREIIRILRPGGHLILTTPNDEKLADHLIACPFCRTEYHHMQHVRSWSAATLSQFLTSHGFEIEFCQAVDINRFQWGQPAGLRAKGRALIQQIQRAVRRLLGRDAVFNYAANVSGENLIAIARKAEPKHPSTR